jgi:hypothetical protein
MCKRERHWHWAPKNKGKGEHSNAKARILKNKIRPAKPCNMGKGCADLNCHCHPVKRPTRLDLAWFKDGVGTLSDLEGKSAADAIDASADVPSQEDVVAKPFPVPPTHAAGADVPHSASCSCCNKAEKKSSRQHTPPESKDDGSDGGPCAASSDSGESEVDVDAELDTIMARINDPTVLAVPTPAPSPEIDAPIKGAPIPKDGVTDSSVKKFSSEELAAITRTTKTTIFFTSNNGVRERKWRTASEFYSDVQFAILTYLGSENESYMTEEKQQVISTRPVTRRRTKSIRWPLFGLKTGTTINSLGVARKHYYPTVRRTQARAVMKREEDVNLNLFKDTYTQSTVALTYPHLTDLLRHDQRMKSKVAVDAGGKLRSTFPARIMDMLAREHSDLLAVYLGTKDGEWILENTLAAHVNHCVLMGLFRNRYSSNDPPPADKPMLNGVKVPSSPSRRSENHTA